jgi:hypothetical protein
MSTEGRFNDRVDSRVSTGIAECDREPKGDRSQSVPRTSSSVFGVAPPDGAQNGGSLTTADAMDEARLYSPSCGRWLRTPRDIVRCPERSSALVPCPYFTTLSTFLTIVTRAHTANIESMADPTIPAMPPPTKAGISQSGLILSLVEIPGILLAAYIFVAAAGTQYTYSGPDTSGSTDTQPLYLSLFLYLAALASLAALVVIVVALLQRPQAKRLRLLIQGNVLAAIFLGIGTTGGIFITNVWNWTNNSNSGDGYSSAPTANGVITQLILAIAAGAATAIFPVIAVFLLRRGQNDA